MEPEQSMQRRDFISAVSAAAAIHALPAVAAGSTSADLSIIDTHQHLWDLSKFQLGWLKDAPAILNRTYLTSDYLAAAKGLNVTKCVYLEVDVDEQQQADEARYISELAQSPDHPTVAAVISGRCDRAQFAGYIAQFRGNDYIKGVRHIVEGAAPGLCLKPQFVRSVQLLGEIGLSFDLTIHPTELQDGLRLVKRCPDTLMIIDHCGVADPKAFMPAHRASARHDAEQWKRDMARLADEKNTVCKISGILAHVPDKWSSGDLAPIVNHCLDVFGPDRVMFGGDWPVCLLGGTLRRWVESLKEIVSDRPLIHQQKLFAKNAAQHYRLVS